MEKIKSIFTREVRGYIYRVSIAIAALLGVYGIFTGEQMAQIIGLLGVVLNIMPAMNTTISKDITGETTQYIPDTQK